MNCFIRIIILLLILIAHKGLTQSFNPKNLVSNGNFESGNLGFFSDLEYSKHLLMPGQYTITNKASRLNSNYREPIGGDHTKGNGYFLVADFSSDKGNIVWKTKITVSPYCKYRFTVYFCNLFDHKKGVFNPFHQEQAENLCAIRMMINGKDVSSTFYDRKNQHTWVETWVEWESKDIKGLVEIAIRSENNASYGNDLALDDISFALIDTDIGNPINKEQFLKHEKPAAVTPAQEEKKHTLKAVVFAVGQSELLEESYTELDSLAGYLINNPSLKIRLEGHTDNIGNTDSLIKLSLERVETVKRYLVSKGIMADRISIIGHGPIKPVADNFSEVTRKLNRRVEVVIY